MCIEIEILFGIIRVEKVWCVVYWLVQLASLTMVACLNVRCHGSKLQQCRMNGGTRHVNLWGSVHTATICITSLQMMTNHKRPNVTHSIRH